jgi:hypothetical protein
MEIMERGTGWACASCTFVNTNATGLACAVCAKEHSAKCSNILPQQMPQTSAGTVRNLTHGIGPRYDFFLSCVLVAVGQKTPAVSWHSESDFPQRRKMITDM